MTEPFVHAAGPTWCGRWCWSSRPFVDVAALAQAEEPERFNDLLRDVWAVPESGGKW